MYIAFISSPSSSSSASVSSFLLLVFSFLFYPYFNKSGFFWYTSFQAILILVFLPSGAKDKGAQGV